MTPSPENSPDPLERLIHRTLRELPPPRAPHSLESRVLAELARRAALPWWRKSFVHWPMAARAAFVVLSIGFVKLALMAVAWVAGGFDNAQLHAAFATQFAWVDAMKALGRTATEFVGVILRNIPPLWFYAGGAIIATLYVAFLGLGAAAYRTLYASR